MQVSNWSTAGPADKDRSQAEQRKKKRACNGGLGKETTSRLGLRLWLSGQLGGPTTEGRSPQRLLCEAP